MNYFGLVIAGIFGVANWTAVEKHWKTVEYIAKPGTMLFLLIWLASNSALNGKMLWFVLGAVFSLAGDVILMLPKGSFIAGLVAFLLAHISFILGLNQGMPAPGVTALIILIVVAAIAAFFYRKLVAGLMNKRTENLKMPLLIYSSVISLMVISALNTLVRPDWTIWPALAVSLGAVLFFVSDAMLAWDRFVSPLNHGHLKVMVSYHLGQAGILIGAAHQFLIK